MEKIEIREIRPGCFPEKHGDWIDLKAGETIEYSTGDFVMIPLGVAMKLPDGYEAHMVPRSSTYKKYHVIQANSVGIIDSAYCGNMDEWMFPAIAVEQGVIHRGDRIAQFRLVKNMEEPCLIPVEHLDGANRGGFGSTGI